MFDGKVQHRFFVPSPTLLCQGTLSTTGHSTNFVKFFPLSQDEAKYPRAVPQIVAVTIVIVAPALLLQLVPGRYCPLDCTRRASDWNTLLSLILAGSM